MQKIRSVPKYRKIRLATIALTNIKELLRLKAFLQDN